MRKNEIIHSKLPSGFNIDEWVNKDAIFEAIRDESVVFIGLPLANAHEADELSKTYRRFGFIVTPLLISKSDGTEFSYPIYRKLGAETSE